MSDVQHALGWVAVVRAALAADENWRLDSDRYIRALPQADRIAPYLFASYLDRRQHLGADPVEVLDMIETALTIIAISGAES